MKKSNIFDKAESKVKAKKAFFVSFVTWAAFSIFFLFLDTNYGSSRLEWAFYPIFFWGFGVFVQSFTTFDFFGLGEKWEKEEIRKEIEKRRQVIEELGDPEDLELLDLENMEKLEDFQSIKQMRKDYKDSDLV